MTILILLFSGLSLKILYRRVPLWGTIISNTEDDYQHWVPTRPFLTLILTGGGGVHMPPLPLKFLHRIHKTDNLKSTGPLDFQYLSVTNMLSHFGGLYNVSLIFQSFRRWIVHNLMIILLRGCSRIFSPMWMYSNYSVFSFSQYDINAKVSLNTFI